MQLLQETILSKRNNQTQAIIKTHYKYHKINDELFEELFCINNALAKLEDNRLRIMI